MSAQGPRATSSQDSRKNQSQDLTGRSLDAIHLDDEEIDASSIVEPKKTVVFLSKKFDEVIVKTNELTQHNKTLQREVDWLRKLVDDQATVIHELQVATNDHEQHTRNQDIEIH